MRDVARRDSARMGAAKWLVAVALFAIAIACAIASTLLIGAIDLWTLLAVAFAALALPAIVAMFAMRGYSAEFRGMWALLLVVATIVWSWQAMGLKVAKGEETLRNAVSGIIETRKAYRKAVEAGRPQDLGAQPPVEEHSNPFLRTRDLLGLAAWRSAENQARYRQRLASIDWQKDIPDLAFEDRKKLGDLRESLSQALGVVDAWGTEAKRIQSELAADVSSAGLPADKRIAFGRAMKELDLALDQHIAAERNVVESVAQELAVLERRPWTRGKAKGDGQVLFNDVDGLYEAVKARHRQDLALRRRAKSAERFEQRTDEMLAALGALPR